MTERRSQFRATDLADPVTSARTLNDTLRDIQLRLEALERVMVVDIQVQTDASGVMSPVSIPAPPWPVRGVLLDAARDLTAGVPFAPARIGWEVGDSGVTVALWSADLSVSTTYQLRLEVRG